MAYDINSYLNKVQTNRRPSGYSFGQGGGLFGKINSGVNNFTSRFNKPQTYNLSSSRVTPYAPAGMSQAPKAPANYTPANASAVSPATTQKPTTPATMPTNAPSSLPASGQTYMNQVMGSSTTTPLQPTLPAPTASQPQPVEQEDPYLKYLNSIFSEESVSEASKAKDDAYARLADIQNQSEAASLQARQQYEATLDKSGGSRSGAQEAAGLVDRRSSSQLADLALQESAATRSAALAQGVYDQAIAAGKTVYEAQQEANKAQEGFTLSEGQTRYDAQGNIIAGGSQASGFDSGYVQGQDPTADSWVQYMRQNGDISKVPDEYKSIALQGMQTQGKELSEAGKNALTIVNKLLGEDGQGADRFGSIFGPFQSVSGGLFGQANAVKKQYQQLKAFLQLDNIKYLKGTGAISDAEQRVLEKASLALGRFSSDKVALKVLQDLKNDLAGTTASQGVQSLPNGNYQTPDGLQWQQLPDGSYQQVSFNQVGSGTANAQSIASAIKQVESQGNYNAKGGSGENGAYQFMPSTWKGWAGEILGNPNAPMTPANQDKVAIAKIDSWIKQGYNPQQIALMWNGGTPTVKKGTNKYGVAYDSGAYANKVLSQLYG